MCVPGPPTYFGAQAPIAHRASLFPAMKAGIHPEYILCRVHCACGNDFETRATKAEIKVEICNECHPFFTGEQKYVDTAGRVDKFRRRAALQAERAKQT